MLEKTRGIFLHAVKYSETSLITSIYTEVYGRQSYLVKGARSKNSTVKASVFQPLYLLDLEIYFRPTKEIHWLKSARIASPYTTIPFDVRKSSQAIFLAEILNKCIREEEHNQELFDFIYHSLTFLDLAGSGINNFHIWFLFKLARYMGISPGNDNALTGFFFDLQKAQFVTYEPVHRHFADKQVTKLFSRLFDVDAGTLEKLDYTHSERTLVLDMLLEFYRIHFDYLGEIRSIEVLKEVFR